MKKFLILKVLSFFDFFHQRKILQFLKKSYSDFKVVFDVGAHEGESINLFSKNFNIESIYSFEASPLNFEKLLKKKNYLIKKFNKTNITLENLALGNNDQDIILNQSDESSSSTINEVNLESKYFINKKKLFSKSNKNFFSKVLVKMITLDTYLERNKINKIDFLKIDTEGYEYDVLQGMKSRIQNVQLILFEHHYDDMIKKNYKYSNINNFLIKNNFKKIYKSKMPFRKTFEYIYKNNNFK